MFTGRSAQIGATIVSAIALNFCLASAVLSQSTSADAVTPEVDKSLEEIIASVGLSQTTSADDSDSAPERTPEEIIVYGQRNVIILRNELNRAQESFFDMYNTLNSDDDFDVNCKKGQKSITQRQRTHRCMPVFALKYAAQASSGFFRSMSNGVAYSDFANFEYQARVKAKERVMWAEIAELAKSNLQFREEIRGLMEAGRAMDAEKERRGPCPKIFCRD